MDTQPRKRAVAIRYKSDEDSAPSIVAKGQGVIAEQILEIAEKHNIPLYEDRDLVEVLSALDLGSAIPPDLYQAVAEVLAFVYRLNNKIPEQGNG